MKTRDSWVTRINLNVVGKRMLWLVGTGRPKWVKASRYKPNDRIRITVEKLPGRIVRI